MWSQFQGLWEELTAVDEWIAVDEWTASVKKVTDVEEELAVGHERLKVVAILQIVHSISF